MRVCLIGEFFGQPDEGMRKISLTLAEKLKSGNLQLLLIDIRELINPRKVFMIIAFKPQIIHYLHGPTLRSLIMLKLLSILCKKSKTISSAFHPQFTYLERNLIPFFRPNIVLVQSDATEAIFKTAGCRTQFFPSGVDISRFKPISHKEKMRLRLKYGLPEDKFILLHIGSIKEGRNIKLLKHLQDSKDIQILVVGALSVGFDIRLKMELSSRGIIVWIDYVKDIEEIYQTADCYIFPTISKYDSKGRAIANSIEMPLTVLEAMATNLPVIATRFGALPRVFNEGAGFYYADNKEEIKKAIDQIRNGAIIQTRDMVMGFAWEELIQQLIRIYEDLTN